MERPSRRVAGRIAIAAALTLALPLVTRSSARAGGFYWPDVGTTALSRGGAFAARADNPTGLIYNPAGVAFVKGTHISFGGTMVLQNVSFQRRQYWQPDVAQTAYPDGPMKGQPMPLVKNNNSPFVAPVFMISTDFGVLSRWNIAVMFGLYGPNAAPNRTFPRYCKPGTDPCEPTDDSKNGVPSPQRYETVKIESLMLFPSIGVAWAPIPQLSFGAVLQLGYSKLGYNTVSTAAGGNPGEDPKKDVDVRLDAESGVTPTGIFGVMIKPVPWLAFGTSLRIGFDFDLTGQLCVGDRESDDVCTIPKDQGFQNTPNPPSVSLAIPKQWLLRTGVRYIDLDRRGRERFDVEFNWVYETTSRLDAFTVLPDENIQVVLTGNIPIAEIKNVVLPHHWRNVMSFRLGGSYRIHDLFKDGTLIFRGGAFYETQAVPEEYARLDFLPFSRFGFAIGVGVRWGRWEFNAAYSAVVQPKVSVDPPDGKACDGFDDSNCGSQVRQLAPLRSGDDKFGNPIGNGTYRVSMHQVTASVRVRFGNSSW